MSKPRFSNLMSNDYSNSLYGVPCTIITSIRFPISGLLVKRVMQFKVCQARSIEFSFYSFYLRFLSLFSSLFLSLFYLFLSRFHRSFYYSYFIFIIGSTVFVLVFIGVLIAFIAVSSPFSPLFLSSLSSCLLGTSVYTERTHCFAGLLRMRLSPQH